ncbi:MAG: hypothetical protein RLZZ505_2372 [Verrucomicrobiota bacterium]|jgi:hypothetical protein
MEIIYLIIIISIAIIALISVTSNGKNKYSEPVNLINYQIESTKDKFYCEFGRIALNMTERLGGEYNSPKSFNIEFSYKDENIKIAKENIAKIKKDLAHFRKILNSLKKQIPFMLSAIDSKLPPHEFGAWGAKAERAEIQRQINNSMFTARHQLNESIDNFIKGIDQMKYEMDMYIIERSN